MFRFWGFILGVVGYCIQGSIIPSLDYKYIAPLLSLFIFPPISPFIYLYCIYGDNMMGIHKLTCIQFVSDQRHSSARTRIGYRLAGQARESIVMSYRKSIVVYCRVKIILRTIWAYLYENLNICIVDRHYQTLFEQKMKFNSWVAFIGDFLIVMFYMYMLL